MAVWMTFLLGRQAMVWQDPPTYFRSTTAVFIPFLDRVQDRSLPAAPLPRMSKSYSSALAARAGPPTVLASSRCCVVFILLRYLFVESLRQVTAVHSDVSPGDKRRLRRGKPHDGGGDIVGLTKMSN